MHAADGHFSFRERRIVPNRPVAAADARSVRPRHPIIAIRRDSILLRVLSRLSPVLLLAACGGGAAQPPIQVHRLASGEEVKVLGVGRINLSASGPALMLKYQTDLSMTDTSALQAEVQRIWAEFRKDAERAQVQSAIGSANSAPTGGLVSRGQTYNFVYEKSGDGEWREVRKQ